MLNFRLLSELYSHLYYLLYSSNLLLKTSNFRLLSELYSHLFKWYCLFIKCYTCISVSYRSYILTYNFYSLFLIYILYLLLFPSPIGVIFSLMLGEYACSNSLFLSQFPSPIGVIFSLILYSKKLLFAIVYKTIIV